MNSELKYLDDFKQILANYQISKESKSELDNVDLLILSAPTAAGRNTIITELVSRGGYHFVVSDTTRKPRTNDGKKEVDGVNYWFKSEIEMLDGLKNGNYLEAAIIHNQQISGISTKELKKTYDDNVTAIADVDVQGVDSIMKIKPNTVAVFVLPPDIDTWMERLNRRGVMSKSELIRRLNSAINEFKFALISDDFIFLINQNFNKTADSIIKIMKGHKANIKTQEKGVKLVKKLIKDTEKLIKKLS